MFELLRSESGYEACHSSLRCQWLVNKEITPEMGLCCQKCVIWFRIMWKTIKQSSEKLKKQQPILCSNKIFDKTIDCNNLNTYMYLYSIRLRSFWDKVHSMSWLLLSAFNVTTRKRWAWKKNWLIWKQDWGKLREPKNSGNCKFETLNCFSLCQGVVVRTLRL